MRPSPRLVANGMVKVGFDAVVFVRALLNLRSRWAGLVFERADEYLLVTSPPIVDELLDVLSRPELAGRFSNRAGRTAEAVREALAAAESVALDAVPPISRDPKDDIYPATAAAAGANFVVGEDRDLLDLGAYQGVRIVDAATFLQLLDAATIGHS